MSVEEWILKQNMSGSDCNVIVFGNAKSLMFSPSIKCSAIRQSLSNLSVANFNVLTAGVSWMIDCFCVDSKLILKDRTISSQLNIINHESASKLHHIKDGISDWYETESQLYILDINTVFEWLERQRQIHLANADKIATKKIIIKRQIDSIKKLNHVRMQNLHWR